mmetsp:Transcript_3573/g.9729  ORF Transcript_3573/g.9729 Transcript_3573/m.9729 type:complete len:249 (-) Transcript_3573:759-1505(-)
MLRNASVPCPPPEPQAPSRRSTCSGGTPVCRGAMPQAACFKSCPSAKSPLARFASVRGEGTNTAEQDPMSTVGLALMAMAAGSFSSVPPITPSRYPWMTRSRLLRRHCAAAQFVRLACKSSIRPRKSSKVPAAAVRARSESTTANSRVQRRSAMERPCTSSASACRRWPVASSCMAVCTLSSRPSRRCLAQAHCAANAACSDGVVRARNASSDRRMAPPMRSHSARRSSIWLSVLRASARPFACWLMQ